MSNSRVEVRNEAKFDSHTMRVESGERPIGASLFDCSSAPSCEFVAANSGQFEPTRLQLERANWRLELRHEHGRTFGRHLEATRRVSTLL